MHNDKDRPLISSEAAPEASMRPSNKTLIPGAALGGRESDDGPQQLADRSLIDRGSQSTLAAASPEVEKYNGLGKPGLLGEDIIPLSGLVAPHLQRHLQPPAPPTPIKPASPGPSRAPPTSGDPVSFEPTLDHPPSTMIFSDLYKAPRTTLSKFRNSFPHGVPPPPDLDADLVSRDKARNKEAVKKYLAEKVRNDWVFSWPSVVAPPPAQTAEVTAPAQEESAQASQDGSSQDTTAIPSIIDEDAPRDPGEEADSESDAESVYSTISEDPGRFRPRAEWTSDLSDSDEPSPAASPFRFDSPDAIGAAVRNSIETKRARRRRAVRDETKWNPGLACFEARRDAWTGAKTVRVKPKPPSPVSPSSARRLFWRHSRTQSSASHSAIITSSSPPAPTSPIQTPAARTSTTTASESDSGGAQRANSQDSIAPPVLHPVHTVVPIPPPLLPPQNPMRASVQPSMYSSLYDKVVVQSLQPSCPVNLADMLRACVVGWKRDGEWPPKSVYPAPAPIQTPNAEVLAMRQRKAQQQRSKNASAANANAAAAVAVANAGRRLSLVGFFNGGGGGGSAGGNKQTVTATATATATHESKDKEGKENHSQSHSDEGAGSGGKTLFRRSLQRVFSLGQHGHAHGNTNNAHGAAANGSGNGPLSPASPSTKEVTAAG